MPPPGPRLPAVAQAALLLRDPVATLTRWRDRYGPVFRLRIPGYPRFVYVAEPGLAREIYAVDRTIGRAGDARRDFLAPVVGEHSMLVTEGEEWLAHRKLLGPAFHRRVVDDYRATIEEIARAEVQRFPRERAFALRPHMQAITLEVILRLVFGLSEGRRLDRLRELIPASMEAAGSPVTWLIPPKLLMPMIRRPRLRRLPGPIGEYLRARDEIDAVLFEEIRDRRAGDAGGTDALAVMVRDGGLDDVAIRDELLTLLEAGHETTATGLAWAFERLTRHPRALERLTEEVRGGEGDEYLRAVVRETLRARPVVIDTPRQLTAPLELGGHTIPAGWVVSPALPLVQGWHEEAFRPERFLEDPEAGRDGWIPFGGGKRHCVGSHLALLELETVIAEVVRYVDVRAADPEPERERLVHVTLAPAEQARVVTTPASPAPRIATAGATTASSRA